VTESDKTKTDASVGDAAEGLRFVLIGHPVGHSLSPPIHRAAYQALGLPHRYELADTPNEAALEQRFAELRSGQLGGANVTVPWKRRALEMADECEPLALETGAANVLAPLPRGRVMASNTDIPALEDELRDAESREVAVVLGAGGAALAAVQACRGLGFQKIHVTTRRWGGVGPAAWQGAPRFAKLGATPLAWPDAAEPAWRELVGRCGVIVQATSAGMAGADPGEELARRIPWELLDPSALAYDVVYNPAVTPFLAAAEASAGRARGGLGMLVEQARHAMRTWFGSAPPADVIRAAVLAHMHEAPSNPEPGTRA